MRLSSLYFYLFSLKERALPVYRYVNRITFQCHYNELEVHSSYLQSSSVAFVTCVRYSLNDEQAHGSIMATIPCDIFTHLAETI